MKCSACGNELKEGAKFCNKCGAKVGEAPASSEKKSKGSSSVKTGIIIACISLAVLLLVVGAVLVRRREAASETYSVRQNREEKRTKREDRKETEEETEEKEDETEEETEESTTKTETEEESSSAEETEMETEAVTEPSIPPEAATAAMPTLAGQGDSPYPSVPGTNAAGGNSEYILPDSSSRRLTNADIAGLTKDQLRLARNEIYARHGRLFSTDELQSYFNGKSWYRGRISASAFSESMLSQIEKDNIKLIQEREDLFQ